MQSTRLKLNGFLCVYRRLWQSVESKHERIYTLVAGSKRVKAVPPDSWLHVPTSENPADCASTGMLPRKLLRHTLWWEGPTWLASDPIQTPKQPSLESLSTPELRVVACNVNVPVPPEWIEGRFSCYHKTIAVTAWCLRFVLNL